MSDPDDHSKSPPPPIAVGIGINRATLLLQAGMERRIQSQGLDITIEQWAVLLRVFLTGEITHGELADRTFRHRTSLTRMIDTLVNKGYVDRRMAEDDKRITLISLSPAGHDLMKTLLPMGLDTIMTGLAGLEPEDIGTLIRLLAHIERNMINDEPGS